MDMLRLSASLLLLALTSLILKLFKDLVWKPYSFTKSFEKQGISGPPYTFLYGSLEEIKRLKQFAKEGILDRNSHDIIPRIQPHFYKWFSLYGDMFIYWFGSQPKLCITEPELAKEVLSNKFGFYAKIKTRPSVLAFLGVGLVMVDGLDWVRHRRILNPAFNIDKIKIMTKEMTACTLSKLNAWQKLVTQTNGRKEIDMSEEFQELTADIIAQTGFGSSFLEGKEVFQVQKELWFRAVASANDVYIPGSQYIPTRWNIQTWKLKRRARNTLKKIIESRVASAEGNSNLGFGNDLLGLMLGTSSMAEKQGYQKLNMDEIIEECKTFFTAGHETTSHLLTWTIFLLSIHSEWQDKLREEVLRECGTEIPDADTLTKLKLVNMVLQETLRLYPPAIALFRKASKDTKLGDVFIPKGTDISIPIAMIQRSKKQWGEDANEFKPLRFADGISKAAKHPNAFLAFSMGPRTCIGQNFSMMEAKAVVAMILQKFTFSLSPQYKHAPSDHLTLQPQFGLPVILQSLRV